MLEEALTPLLVILNSKVSETECCLFIFINLVDLITYSDYKLLYWNDSLAGEHSHPEYVDEQIIGSDLLIHVFARVLIVHRHKSLRDMRSVHFDPGQLGQYCWRLLPCVFPTQTLESKALICSNVQSSY